MEHVLVIFGTRPEWIKILPVIREFISRGSEEQLFIVNTHQHEELLSEEVIQSGIQIHYQFKGKRDSGSLNQLTGLLMSEFHVLKKNLDESGIKIRLVLAQGDTATTFCSALFAFHEQLPFYHIEAGLRTHDFRQPFPEEFYRKTISGIAAFHFAPTAEARQNLIDEGIEETKILVTGNTVIDNLVHYQQNHPGKNETGPKTGILITVHRRENQNGRFEHIFSHIDRLCRCNPELPFTWISHPGLSLEDRTSDLPANLVISKPLSYHEMISLYSKTSLIITDSGGIQEEAAFLGIPVVVLRSVTERPEGIANGISMHFNQDETNIDQLKHQMNQNRNNDSRKIYGTGNASKNIVGYILNNHPTL